MRNFLMACSFSGALLTAAAPAWAQQTAPAATKPAPAAKAASAKKAAPAAAQAPTMVGTWSGTVAQSGSKGYSVVLTIRQGGGDTEYSELGCAGKLTRVGAQGGFIFYIETITQGGIKQGGRCIDGSITVTMLGEKLAWGWVGTHETRVIVAQSLLQRRQ
jgi:hypothetical protein